MKQFKHIPNFLSAPYTQPTQTLWLHCDHSWALIFFAELLHHLFPLPGLSLSSHVPPLAALFSKPQSHWYCFVSNYHYWVLAAPWWSVGATELQAFVSHHAACLFPRLLTLATEQWTMRARVLHSSVSLLFWPGDKKQQRVATFNDLECRTYSRHLILTV